MRSESGRAICRRHCSRKSCHEASSLVCSAVMRLKFKNKQCSSGQLLRPSCASHSNEPSSRSRLLRRRERIACVPDTPCARPACVCARTWSGLPVLLRWSRKDGRASASGQTIWPFAPAICRQSSSSSIKSPGFNPFTAPAIRPVIVCNTGQRLLGSTRIAIRRPARFCW